METWSWRWKNNESGKWGTIGSCFFGGVDFKLAFRMLSQTILTTKKNGCLI